MVNTELAEPLQDAEDVGRVTGGETRAFERLVHRYHGTVYSIALSYLRRREAAEELTQEVFLRAWLHLGSLKSAQMFLPWVLRMTRNLAVDWLRHERRSSTLVQLVPLEDDALEVADPHRTNACEMLATTEEHMALQQAVFELPADQRELVLLHYAEDMSRSDIARRLQVHPSSVGRKLGTALFALRVQLDSQVRIRLQPLRSRRQNATRAAAIVLAASVLPNAAKAAVVVAVPQCTVAGSTLSLLPHCYFSAAVRVRTLMAGARHMITPFRIAALASASALLATAFYMKPEMARAQAPTNQQDIGTMVQNAVQTSIQNSTIDGESVATPKLSGKITTESRKVENFKGVNTAGPIDAKIQVGAPTASVQITADDQLQKYIDGVVEDSILKIRPRCNLQGSKINVTVDVPELERVALAGSGDIDIKDLTGANFEARLSGSGNVKARGSVDQLSVHLAGSGEVEMEQVVAKDVAAKIAGSGRVEVNASHSLDANVTGSGSVKYSGSVTDVKKKVTGSGRVEKK
jgi:RNA polymerase sigma factor (sigma-70 family)